MKRFCVLLFLCVGLKIGSSELSREKVVDAKSACAEYSQSDADVVIRMDHEHVRAVEYPWMAALFYPSTNSLQSTYGCGGTIISEWYVMTAAHCVQGFNKPIQVQVGKLTLNEDDGLQSEIYLIKNIKTHPGYNPLTQQNDIALIQTQRRIRFNDNVLAACLHTEKVDIDSELIKTSWGFNSNHLLQTKMATIKLDKCNSTYLDWNKDQDVPTLRNGIRESQYCAYAEENRNSCRHPRDSGSPIQYFPNSNSSIATIVGIVSFGVPCTTLPVVHTRVAHYINWIESIVWPLT